MKDLDAVYSLLSVLAVYKVGQPKFIPGSCYVNNNNNKMLFLANIKAGPQSIITLNNPKMPQD